MHASETAPTARHVGQRWTHRLAQSGWTPVCDYFLKNCRRLRITPTSAMVIIHLMSFKWDDKAPFPGLKTIAARMGITPTSVRAHIRKLEQRGLLYRRYTVGGTNRFLLEPLFARLEALMDEERAAAETADAD